MSEKTSVQNKNQKEKAYRLESLNGGGLIEVEAGRHLRKSFLQLARSRQIYSIKFAKSPLLLLVLPKIERIHPNAYSLKCISDDY